MEKDKKMDFVKNAEVTVSGIEIETDPNNSENVKRIRFVTDKGNVTWKPKITEKRFVGGIIVLSKVPMRIISLPQKLEEMSKLLQMDGTIKLRISYSTLEAEKDGIVTLYRFIMSEKSFNDWEILPKTKQKEELIE